MTRFAPLLLLLAAGCATHRSISGQVVDRNGNGLERVNVKLSPGNVELVTDDEGRFTLDYLRDEEGNRIHLKKKTAYTVDLFKIGFHDQSSDVSYTHGDLVLEPITMTEETISVDNTADDIDPARHPDQAQNSGGSYEGE